MSEHIIEFCTNPSKETYRNIPQEYRYFMYRVSNFVIENNIGKELLANKIIEYYVDRSSNIIPFPGSPGIPTEFEQIAEDCSKNERWEKGEKLGRGLFGYAYETFYNGNRDNVYVVKVQKNNKEFKAEVNALMNLRDTGVVPKLYAAWTCQNDGYFVMEKLERCSLSKDDMYSEVKNTAEKIYEAGWLHNDIHQDNIMCSIVDGKPKVIIIDFGLAVNVKNYEDDDNYKYYKRRDKNNKFTIDHLKSRQDRLISLEFNPKLSKEQRDEYVNIEREYMRLWSKLGSL